MQRHEFADAASRCDGCSYDDSEPDSDPVANDVEHANRSADGNRYGFGSADGYADADCSSDTKRDGVTGLDHAEYDLAYGCRANADRFG